MLNYCYGYLGTIPSTIGQLTKLDFLDFFLNKLTGAIPTSFGLLSSLLALSLSYNSLIGNFLLC